MALMQSRLDHFDTAGNKQMTKQWNMMNKSDHYKSDLHGSDGYTMDTNGQYMFQKSGNPNVHDSVRVNMQEGHGPHMQSNFDRHVTRNVQHNLNNSGNPDFNPNLNMSQNRNAQESNKFQEDNYDGTKFHNNSEFNHELKNKEGQQYTRSLLFHDFNRNKAKMEFDRQDNEYYNNYKDKRYLDLEEKILRLEEDVKIMQTQLILKDKEVLNIKNDTLHWYEDSVA